MIMALVPDKCYSEVCFPTRIRPQGFGEIKQSTTSAEFNLIHSQSPRISIASKLKKSRLLKSLWVNIKLLLLI